MTLKNTSTLIFAFLASMSCERTSADEISGVLEERAIEAQVAEKVPPGQNAVAKPSSAIVGLASEPGRFVEERGPELAMKIGSALASQPASYIPRTKHVNPDGSPQYTNRLIFERSPYLKQHAHNPVDWYPWGDEAFETAERLGRPVFLSIGYTTCHWCHVMEEESFEDVEIAQYLNSHFVPVKLDREERPDVDSVYMTAVNVLTGRGGWPMSVWMTHNREPFMAGTYFPPRDGDRGSLKGFLTLLRELNAEYTSNPADAVSKASELVRKMNMRLSGSFASRIGDGSVLHRSVQAYSGIYDTSYGGFGRGNKFPRPSNLEFLLRYARRAGDEKAKKMVQETLDAMLLGGLYDHVDDGFHRYTTERRFRIPHFEKMLYDNAQLVPLYLDAYAFFGDERYRDVAVKTLEYLLRDMRDSGGAFYSATDADSEGEEGVFAVWNPQQIRAIMGPDEAEFMMAHFHVTEKGNFEHQTTVLYTTGTVEDTARKLGVEKDVARVRYDAGHRAMFQARRKREQPILDDKILTAWNGLALSAFARAALQLQESRFLEAARDCARFLKEEMFRDETLKRRYHSGQVRFNAVLDDYAYLIQGLIDLYEADGDLGNIEWAEQLQAQQDEKFSSAQGGYFRAGQGERDLIVREVPDYDGARPSGNSVSAMNLLRLYAFTGKPFYLTRAEGVFRSVGRGLFRGSTAQPKLLSALDYYLDRDLQIVFAGKIKSSQALLAEALENYWMPNRVIGYQGNAAKLESFGILADKTMLEGKETVYVCEEGVCQRPVHTPKDLLRQIQSLYSPLEKGPLKELQNRGNERK